MKQTDGLADNTGMQQAGIDARIKLSQLIAVFSPYCPDCTFGIARHAVCNGAQQKILYSAPVLAAEHNQVTSGFFCGRQYFVTHTFCFA
jgi:hypothetical protein